jgi:hypothetical protein
MAGLVVLETDRPTEVAQQASRVAMYDIDGIRHAIVSPVKLLGSFEKLEDARKLEFSKNAELSASGKNKTSVVFICEQRDWLPKCCMPEEKQQTTKLDEMTTRRFEGLVQKYFKDHFKEHSSSSSPSAQSHL